MRTGQFKFTVALRPQRPSGLLGTGAQDGHLEFHTAPELRGEEAKLDSMLLYVYRNYKTY